MRGKNRLGSNMITTDYIYTLKKKIPNKAPLIHNITNYVVMNNTANALLAIGASPVMAHASQEVEEMVSFSSALVLNMGTLSEKWIEAMLLAGTAAQKKGIPIVFDPVGMGATHYRNKTATEILKHCKPTVIRANASEIMALARANVKTKGVDSTSTTEQALIYGKQLAIDTKAVIVISGETDYITDGQHTTAIKNGSEMMTMVTGMGCTATAIIGAFCAIETDMFKAASAAMAILAIAGEIASEKANGPGSLQMHLLDMLYSITEKEIAERARIE